MNIYITDAQAENTRVGYSIMWGIPAERVDLDRWRTPTPGQGYIGRCVLNDAQMMNECGSAGCIAGWFSLHPYFKARGLRYSSQVEALTYNGQRDMSLAGQELFGCPSMFWGGTMGKSGKAEALRRLRLHLLSAGRITSERNAELAREEALMLEVKERHVRTRANSQP